MRPHPLLIISIIALLVSNVGCSSLKNLGYRIDVNQGNYLAAHEIQQLKRGMTQNQVLFLLGSPALQDLFSPSTRWNYLCYQRHDHQPTTQKNLQLLFNSQGELQRVISNFPGVPPELSGIPETRKNS